MQNTAMWLASIFGPFLIILGLWKLLYSSHLVKVMSGTKNSVTMLYYSSIFNLLVGFTVLSQYDAWGWNPFVLVTLLGWCMVVRGIMGMFVPQLLVQIFMTNQQFIKIMGIIPLVWGLALAWVGFFM